MRMQARFEITEGLGDLLENYKQQLRNENPTLLELDRARRLAFTLHSSFMTLGTSSATLDSQRRRHEAK